MNRKWMSMIALAAFAVAPVAQAEIAGTVGATTGDVGSVLVVRDGEVYSLATGDTLLVGDVVHMALFRNSRAEYCFWSYEVLLLIRQIH